MLRNILLCAATLLTLNACSTANTQDNAYNSGIYDPFENTNRAIFSFNTTLDDAIIHPAITGYRAVTPKPARTGLRNFLRHLSSPVNFANQALQGDIEGAKNVALRATINTFVGFGGIMDTAGMEGIPYEQEDFGQTLAVWGVGPGPYIVVPFFGGSNLRDTVGFAVDGFVDPLRLYASNIDENHWNYYRGGLMYLDMRNSLYDALKDLDGSSFDYYAAVRSAYYQQRSALVSDLGQNMNLSPTAEFDEFY